MSFRKAALVAATALAGTTLVAAPAQSQQRQQAQQGQQPQPAQPQLSLTRAEVQAAAPLVTAIRAQDWAAATAALPAVQAAMTSADGRYFVARAMWQVGNRSNNTQLELQGLDTLVGLTNVPANELPVFLRRQGELAFAAQDFAKAERAFARLAELQPGDATIAQNLSIIRRRMGNSAGALEPVLRQISEAEARGERAPEELYRRALGLAQEARQLQPTLDHGMRLVRAYPTAANWRSLLSIYRQVGNLDAQAILDTMRLARAAGALEGESDYVGFAELTNQAGLPGETSAIIEEGIQRGAVQRGSAAATRLLSVAGRRMEEDRSGLASQIAQARSASTGRLARVVADALYGYGRYAEAADLYRVALTKGGEDANVVNLRLGAALAMAGQRGEAETALRAVTGNRAQLAALWQAWLAGRPG
jgi:tetratricopeptide (TPR) repeat protein